MNKYERDAIRDVVDAILRNHINSPGDSIDTHQMRLVIEKGHASRIYPFDVGDVSRSDEFAEEIDRLMRLIARGVIGKARGYRLTENKGRAQLTFFDTASQPLNSRS